MNHPDKIGLGTAAIGRPEYINIRQEEKRELSLDQFIEKGKSVLDEAYNRGIRYFDTAPGYGMAEEMLIDWLNLKNDPNIEVASKWGYTYLANFEKNAEKHEEKEHSLAKLNNQWEHSKKLFPYLTTYQIHSATFESGVLENEAVLHRLAELKEEHQLKIGLTTSGANQLDVLKRSLDVEIEGSPLFDAFQVTYNVFDQSLADIARELAFSGKRLIIKEAMANGRVFPNERFPHYQAIYETLLKLAEKYGVGVDAVALGFCMSSIPVYKVLSGASNSNHLTSNIEAEGFKLERVEIETLKGSAVEPEAYWLERKSLGWA